MNDVFLVSNDKFPPQTIVANHKSSQMSVKPVLTCTTDGNRSSLVTVGTCLLYFLFLEMGLHTSMKCSLLLVDLAISFGASTWTSKLAAFQTVGLMSDSNCLSHWTSCISTVCWNAIAESHNLSDSRMQAAVWSADTPLDSETDSLICLKAIGRGKFVNHWDTVIF